MSNKTVVMPRELTAENGAKAMKTYLIMLVFNGQYIAMQFLDAVDDKKAFTEGNRTINPFSGAWVEVMEVK